MHKHISHLYELNTAKALQWIINLLFRMTFYVLCVSILCFSIGCTRTVVADKLEAYVMIGFHQPPKNPEPGTSTAQKIKPNETLSFWIREVYSNKVNTPIPNRLVDIDVVDPAGFAISNSNVSVNIPSLLTSEAGFNSSALIFRSSVPGVFLIRATYADKQARSVSYSAPIIVLSGA